MVGKSTKEPELLHLVLCSTPGCIHEGMTYSIFACYDASDTYVCAHCGRPLSVTISDENYARKYPRRKGSSQR